jgi:hypothetical protein
VALAGTVKLAGTTTAGLLLERLTVNPPAGAAALSVTVHVSVPDPVREELLQLSVLNVASDAVPDGPLFALLTTSVPQPHKTTHSDKVRFSRT